MSDYTLEQIQSWTKAVLTRRGNLTEKITNASRHYNLGLEQLIQTKGKLSAYQRLDIYASGYVLRLLDCLYTDYPCLRHFMGEELFDLFAKAYILNLPSESYSLYHFTARFPEYLQRTRPRHQDANPQQKALFELPAEIAAFERAKAEIAIAKGTEHLQILVPDMLQLLQASYLFQTPECLRLLQQNYPLLDLMRQLEAKEETTIPEAEETYVGISRKNFRLQIKALSNWQYHFLKSCADAVSLSAATQQTAHATGMSTQELSAKILLWIPIAVELGFLTTLNSK